jgi:hypothetical protein
VPEREERESYPAAPPRQRDKGRVGSFTGVQISITPNKGRAEKDALGVKMAITTNISLAERAGKDMSLSAAETSRVPIV